MPSGRRQFAILYRDFLRRIVDLDVLSSQGEIERLLVQFAAALAAFNLAYLFFSGPKYMLAKIPASQLRLAVASEFEFLVATTMAVAGLFAVLAWNTVLPDRRDCMILGLLPVHTRTVFLAKAAAIATALGVAIVALNCFTGITFPFLALPGPGIAIALRSLIGYWMAMAAAGLFVCGGMLALQGLAAQLLPYRHFLRVSSFLQLAAFFTILAAYFLKPPGAVPWLPSSWFFGLQQQLSGANPTHPLAVRAALSLAAVCGIAAITFALAYARSIRKIVEQPDILPSPRRHQWPRLRNAILRRAVDRAIVLFTARTVARSRQHRLFLAAYGGIGLAIALAYARDLLYGSNDIYTRSLAAKWNQLNVPLLMAGLVLQCFAIAGARAIFSLPVALRANWIFQLTAIHPPRDYFLAIRKSLCAVTVLPVFLACVAAYFLIWPARFAAQHLLVVAIAAAILVHRSLAQFRKIPFACSYLPGKSNLHVKIGVYGLGLLGLASTAVQIEYAVIPRPTGFTIFCLICLVPAIFAWRRWRDFANSPYNWLQFEDLPAADLESLDLHNPPSGIQGPLPPLEAGRPARPRGIFDLAPAYDAPPPPGARAHFEQFLADLRCALRISGRSPGFSAAAVALMAVGIGGNTAVYSIIHSILHKPAPGMRAANLVNIAATLPGDPNGDVFSFSVFSDYLSHTQSLQDVTALSFERVVMTAPDATWELRGQLVTPNYFDILGVPIVKGRGFTPAEVAGTSGLSVVIAWHVWRTQFQAAPDIEGSRILFNGLPATIIGVSGPGFRGTHFAPNFEIAAPILAYTRLHEGGQPLNSRVVEVVGRLAPRATVEQAQTECNAIARIVAVDDPHFARHRITVVPYSATSFGPWQTGQGKMFMGLITAVALLTLLVVCANVANLMIGRSTARRRELAVRQSLGASRWRIVSLQLSEGLVLSAAAAVAAWVFAWWVARAVPSLIPPLESGARLEPDLAPDWRVALYAIGLAVAGAIVFTLAPSLRAWRQDILPFLKAGDHGVIQGRSRLANALVVIQLAFCVLLLSGAGLATRSIFLIQGADLGYSKDHRLILRLNTLGAGTGQRALLENLRERIAAISGVAAVSYATSVPPDPFGQFSTMAGQTPVHAMVAGPHYLDALGVRPQGRDFDTGDDGRDITVITRRVADGLEGQPVLGRTVILFGRPFEIAGIVPNAAYSGMREQGGDRFVFVSRTGNEQGGVRYFNIRYAGPVAATASAVRGIVRDASITDRIVGAVQTMDTFLQQYTAPGLVIGTLLGIFSVGSLIVAGIGLYAVIAFHTARRTREFGIRLALGASGRDVVRTVFREGVVLAAVGSAIGLALSVAAGRLLSSVLFGVKPIDPLTWSAVVALLTAVTLAACTLPARRAARIEPLEALRHE